MWNKIGQLLFVTLLLCNPAVAADGRFTLVPSGGRVPFQATGFDDVATAKLLTWKEFQERQFQNRLRFEIDIQRAEYEFKLNDLRIELEESNIRFSKTLELRDKEIKDLRAIIKKDRKVNIPLLVTASVLGGVALGVGAAYAVNQATR